MKCNIVKIQLERKEYRMMKTMTRIGRIVICCLMVLAAPLISSAETLKIITGTSNIAEVVQQIGGDSVEINIIIPGGACPGHYDVRPGDIAFLTNADALLLHPWQKEQTAIRNLLAAAGNLQDVMRLVPVKGNWLIPDVELQAISTIKEILQDLNPELHDQYEARAQERTEMVQATGDEIRAQLEQVNVFGMPVVCAAMQQEFVAWAGFQIVDSYGRPEELTPAKMAELITKAKEQGVKLFIDNLQSGKDAGQGMAGEIGAAQVTISNFVGGLPETDSWEGTVKKNVAMIVEALQGL